MVPSAPRLLLMVEAIRRLEAQLASATSLMARAGAFLAEYLTPWASKGHPLLFLCGPGNNGGDGLVAARLLRAQGFCPQVVTLPNIPRPAEAAAAWQSWCESAGSYLSAPPTLPSDGPRPVIVDACFGIGLNRPIGPPYDQWLAWANEQLAQRIAVDLPSGLNADTGERIGPVTFRAHETVTFLADKPGLHTGDGPDYAGHVVVASLEADPATIRGYPFLLPDEKRETPSVAHLSPVGVLLAPSLFSSWLQPRPRNTHKGQFGHAVLIGGAKGMVGALHLAARAALALGAGKVSAIALSDTATGFDPLAPEVMWPERVPDDATVIAIGPGLGQTSTAIAYLEPLLLHPATLVLDADALNLVAAAPTLAEQLARRTKPTILTPHPGEAARLLRTTTSEVQHHRIAAAYRLATELRAVVILKGCGAVIAEPGGRWAINPSGHGGMASGGMGDALTGLIAALLAQGCPPFPAAALAALLHGAAAEELQQRGVGPIGLTASETLVAARACFNQWCHNTQHIYFSQQFTTENVTESSSLSL